MFQDPDRSGKDRAGRHRGGADTARSDKGTDDGMKMGSLGGLPGAASGQRTVGDRWRWGWVAGAVSARRTVGWMGMGHGEDK